MITLLAHFLCLISIFFLQSQHIDFYVIFLYFTGLQGVTIQARALRRYMKRLKDQLVEGKVYALSHFTVCPREHEYMACRNGSMIYMDGQTVVDEIDNNIGSSIPLHSFEFVDFDDVPSRNGDKRFYTGTWLGLGELLV